MMHVLNECIQWNGYANCKQISGATVTLVEDTPDTTDGVVKISGSPEQSEKAQSLLQGFILSSASLSLSLSLSSKPWQHLPSIISLNKNKITSIILHHNINCINKLPKAQNINIYQHTNNKPHNKHFTTTITQWINKPNFLNMTWMKSVVLVNHHLLAVASRRKPSLSECTHTHTHMQNTHATSPSLYNLHFSYRKHLNPSYNPFPFHCILFYFSFETCSPRWYSLS